MNIKLDSLSIKDFKGLKSFEFSPRGNNATIIAQNGVGKTTVFDAFLWLLFGKNSDGKKDFEVRPLDKNNKPIKGLEVAVEAVLIFDGVSHTLRKEQHEKLIKGKLTGYETLCWIDEVPKKVGEFMSYIKELIPEDTFKMLTDLSYFNGRLHWSDRRQVLVDVAGESSTPKGFDSLLAVLNGREIADYKKVIAEQKKRLTDEQSQINPRIDELQRGLDEYAGIDNGTEITRQEVIAEIAKLDANRKKVTAEETERQQKLNLINELEKKKTQREAELLKDTSGIQVFLDEKVTIEKAVGEKEFSLLAAKDKFAVKSRALANECAALTWVLSDLDSVRDEFNAISQAEPTSNSCYACGQKLPAGKITELEQAKKHKRNAIVTRGNALKEKIDNEEKAIAAYKKEIVSINSTIEKCNLEFETAKTDKEKRFAEIEELIAANPTPSPLLDKICLTFDKQIKKITKDIGEPVTAQIESIDMTKAVQQNELAELDKILAQADQIKKNTTRIAELEAKEKELAQKIADVEKQLCDISEYETAESRMLEEAVNGKFKYVEFKLFNQLLNGGNEPACEATYNGVPYADLSTGQKIFVGIDIVNVLSAHYGLSVPLFCDHSESLTMPIEATSQVIKLHAQNNCKELKVEIEKKEATNAAK